ncbi:MAG: phage tail protein [Microcystis sp.]
MDFLIGQILLFAGDFAPVGWAFCDGSELPISGYQALYSILGTKYGGNGRTSFALPKLPTVKNVHKEAESRYIICLEGIYPFPEK